MQQPAQLSLGVPPIQPLLDFAGGFLPLAPFLCMGVYREDCYLQIFPTMIFSFSICSLHYCSLFLMVVVLILYTSPQFAEDCEQSASVFVINIDDEK